MEREKIFQEHLLKMQKEMEDLKQETDTLVEWLKNREEKNKRNNFKKVYS